MPGHFIEYLEGQSRRNLVAISEIDEAGVSTRQTNDVPIGLLKDRLVRVDAEHRELVVGNVDLLLKIAGFAVGVRRPGPCSFNCCSCPSFTC